VALGALAIVVASVVIAKRRQTGIAPPDSEEVDGPAAPGADEQPAKTASS
jgi:hypothetical protein